MIHQDLIVKLIVLFTSFQKYNYFTSDEPERVKLMTEVEKLCEALSLTRYENIIVKDRKKYQGRKKDCILANRSDFDQMVPFFKVFCP